MGPYREVAVLSGLVARGGAVGAWASHIVVTTPEAAAGGREIYGLPTDVANDRAAFAFSINFMGACVAVATTLAVQFLSGFELG